MKIELEAQNLLTVDDAAKALGITRITLYRWMDKGKIATAKFGTYRIIPISEIERLKKEREKND